MTAPSPVRRNRFLLLGWAVLCSLVTLAQGTRYWTGGSGAWADPAHWASTPGGPGGAGAPTLQDAAVISGGPFAVQLAGTMHCRGLLVDGTTGTISLTGNSGRLGIHGDLELRGSAHWPATAAVELSTEGEAALRTRGIPLGGDVTVADGHWSMANDLVVDDAHDLILRAGTLRTNNAMLRAGALRTESTRQKALQAGTSVIMLQQPLSTGDWASIVQEEGSYVVVDGEMTGWGPEVEALRGINVCGTGPGQTMFTINAHLVSNYNGFGVSCFGVCDGIVRVTITGGSGNFRANWVGGPQNSQIWNNVCTGNRIVVVTDLTQNISCATTVQVTDPALLTVIFYGEVPPSCAGVCDGVSNVFAVGGVPEYDYDWNSGAGSGESFTQLCPGLNTLEVTDQNGCVFDTTFLFNLHPILPGLTVDPVSCHGDCDGTATSLATGGGGGFVYDWGPGSPPGDGTPSVTGLCPGNYTLLITDVNGCDTTVQFTITEPDPILPHPSSTHASCSSSCDGSAQVAPTGAPGGFVYLWSPGGATTASVTDLCAGTYTCLVTELATGCDTLVTFTIDAPASILPNEVVTPVLCAGACTGIITTAPTGGAGGPWTWNWTPVPPNGQGQPNATGLCAGIWSVTITDAAGCDTTLVVDLVAPPPITVDTSKTDVSCAGACDGTATAIPAGGTGTLSVIWSPGGATTPTVTGLCAGTWTATITDAAGCDTAITFVITEPLPLAATASQTNVTCGGTCDGTASVAVSGGTLNYTYSWSPAAGGQGTPDATGLCAGPVEVLITDDHGCTLVQSFTILDAVPMTVVVNSVDASCPGACDGMATVNVSGGQPTYTLIWSPVPGNGQGVAFATGLCAQDYSLTVRDALGCDTTVTVTIGAPDPIAANGTVTDVTCHGDCDGSITLAPSGGNGTYTYAWTPPVSTGPVATGLCAGIYEVVVASGACDTTLVFTVGSPTPLTATVTTTPATCANSCDGTASVVAGGGTSGYTYLWVPAPGNGQGTPNGTDMCPGTYALTVTDASGCDTTLTLVITAPAPLDPHLTVTPETCLGSCTGTATIAVTGAQGAIVIDWSPNAIIGDGTTHVTGLCAGTAYEVRITDAAGCDTVQAFTVAPVTPLVASVTPTAASCTNTCDGAATATLPGGTTGLTLVWSGPPTTGQGTTAVTGLCPGPQTLTITNAEGCDTTLTFTIDAPVAIEANATLHNVICFGSCEGSITLAPTGGNGTFGYAWSPNVGTGPVATALCAGVYSVVITSGGCDTTYSFTITSPPRLDAGLVTTNTTCHNGCDGTATVQASGGSPDYHYEWMPPPGGGGGDTPNATSMCPDTYVVIITDSVGCDTTFVFEIMAPDPIDPGLTVLDETCVAPCTGSASVVVTGGQGGFSIDWSPGAINGDGTPNVTDLCAGTYSVHITDLVGCDTTVTFTVDPYAPVAVTITTTPESCPGACDGTATAQLPGGTAGLTLTWSGPPSGGQGTTTATGLCPGPYTLTLSTAAGCDTVIDFTIGAPIAIDPHATVTHPTCHGDCNGSIVLAPSGGNGTYSYSWSPGGSTGSSLLNACAGTYTVTITSGGCSVTGTYVLTPAPALALTATVQQSHCSLCDGSIQLHTTGGTGAYTFQWGAPIGLVTTDSVQTGLCAGIYHVQVTDANGCSRPIIVVVPDSGAETLTTTDGQESCPGACDGQVSVAFACSAPSCTVAWTDASGNPLGTGLTLTDRCPGTYFVVVTNGDGCIAIDSAVVAPAAPFAGSISSTPQTCAAPCDGTATLDLPNPAAATITWSPQPGSGQGTTHATLLCAGTYTVLVDMPGTCDSTFTVTITAPAPFHADDVITAPLCGGVCDGAIDLTVSGGNGTNNFVWSPSPGLGQGTSSVSQLCANVYTVSITDVAGCDTTFSYIITEPQPLALNITATDSHCSVCDGGTTASVQGGIGTPAIVWTDASNNAVGSGPTLTGLCAGLYTATATDQNGCTVQGQVIVQDANGEVLTVVDGHVDCATACNGEVSVSYTCSTPDCITSWYTPGGTLLATGTNVLSGLCAGPYIVHVVNGDGCLRVDTAEVLPTQVFTIAWTATPATCHGDCNGTADVTVSGGAGDYSYAWSTAGLPDTNQVSGLCAGDHTVVITDAAGCDTTVTITVPGPGPIALNITSTPPTCASNCDGSILVNASGSNGGFSIVWAGPPPSGANSNPATGLCAGNWTATITDILGCDTTVIIPLADPVPLVAAASSTPSTCGLCSGTATALPTGGHPGYTFSWSLGGSVVSTDSIATGLCAGIYTLTVTDANGCSAQTILPLGDQDGEVLSTTDDHVTCPTDCDGEVSVAFTCNTPNCSTAWYTAGGVPLGQTTNTATGLCAGQYLVQVTNGGGCISFAYAEVFAPDPIVANATLIEPRCDGDCNGSIVLNPSGGTGSSYLFDWSPGDPPGDGTNTVTGLCAGTWSVTITDAVGCTATETFTLDAPLPVTATTTVVPLTCAGACDASITVNASGGAGDFTYAWTPGDPTGDGTATVTGLCADTWSVTITDLLGCDTEVSVTITEPDPLVTDLTTTDNACFGDCSGTASLTISGGVPAYAISWLNAAGDTLAQSTNSIGGLCAGTYSVHIADANGCARILPFTIDQGDQLDVALVFHGESCNGPCDGNATLTSSDPDAYTFNWSHGPTGAGLNTVSALCAGDYTVLVTDAAGCDTTFSFTIAPFAPFAVAPVVDQVTCHGACDGAIALHPSGGTSGTVGSTFSWSPPPPVSIGDTVVSGLCPQVWTVTITDVAGCSDQFSFTITEPDAITISLDAITDASCGSSADGAISVTLAGGTGNLAPSWSGPGSFTSTDEDISGLQPGDHILTVTDDSNCSVTMTFTVGTLNDLEAHAGADITQCSGTALLLDGSTSVNADTYTWTDLAGRPLGQGAQLTLTDLPAGTHSIILQVANGACTDADTVVVQLWPTPVADAGPDQTFFNEGRPVLGGQPSGPSGSTFIWSPDSVLSAADVPNPTATLVQTTWFHLQVVSPEGCVGIDSVLITIMPEFVVPSGFTPNGDGWNDTWQIDLIHLFPNCVVEVFNRWGEPLFRSVGYKQAWDGRYGGGLVPIGTYYYAITLNDPEFPEPFTGPLTVIR